MPFIFISPLEKFIRLITNLDVSGAARVVNGGRAGAGVCGDFAGLFRNSFATEGADNLTAEAFYLL
jgi:hypothetical protein